MTTDDSISVKLDENEPVTCLSVTVRQVQYTPSLVDMRRLHELLTVVDARSSMPAETLTHHVHCTQSQQPLNNHC